MTRLSGSKILEKLNSLRPIGFDVGLNHWGCQPAFQLSAIDTMSFIEYGDVQRNFSKWLDTFVDLAPLGITSEELWEFCNSLVHMTNLSSRAVIAGKASPICIFIGQTDELPLAAIGQPKPFSLIPRWIRPCIWP